MARRRGRLRRSSDGIVAVGAAASAATIATRNVFAGGARREDGRREGGCARGRQLLKPTPLKIETLERTEGKHDALYS